MRFDLKLDFGDLDSDDLKTEEAIREAARRVMPQAVKQYAAGAAAALYATTLKSLKRTGLKVSSSGAEKAKFIREKTREIEAKLSAADRRAIEAEVVAAIKARLAEVDAGDV